MNRANSGIKNRQETSYTGSNYWILIISFVLMFLLSIAAQIPLAPNDFFPYVRIGQEIVSSGHIPQTEFMTYTQFGKPVDFAYWIPSIIFYFVYKIGGVLLTSLLILLLTCISYMLVWLCFRKLGINSLISGSVIILLGLYAASFFVARPQIFAFPLFLLTLYILIKWQDSDNNLIWILPFISICWVNLHGSFIVLFFLLIPALVFGKGNRKLLLVFTLLAFLATFANKSGPLVWRDIFSVLGNDANRIYSKEFQPPLNKGWQANIFFAILLFTPFLASLSKNKIPVLYWVWFLGFGWMGLSAVRYGIWFFMIATILIIASLLNPLTSKIPQRFNLFQNRKLNIALSVLMLLIPVGFLPGIRDIWWTNAPGSYNDMTPVDATAWLKQNSQLPGELWSDFEFSTYLTYALPERKLFMTNRMDDFPISQYEDEKAISNAFFDWQSLLDKYGVNIILASRINQANLIKAVGASKDWVESYADDQAVIFVRELTLD